MMKSIAIAALGAASLSRAAPTASPIADAIEDLLALKTEQVAKFEILTLGGMTLRAEQVYNKNFVAAGRGPRAYVQSLRKYSSFGATIAPDLLCNVEQILQELGLGSLGDAASNCPTSGTGSGDDSGNGKGNGNGGVGIAPNGTASGNGTSAGGVTGTFSR